MRGWNALTAAARGPTESFRAALVDPAAAQRSLLAGVLRANRDTVFGRDHQFAAIEGVDAYRAAVPIRNYEGFRRFVDRIASGEPGVLTRGPVVAFEATGGSSGGRKLIPYVKESFDGFRQAALVWLADLARRRPAATSGGVYVAISPALREQVRTPAGVPIGLASDADYLGEDLAAALAPLIVAPRNRATNRDFGAWRIATLVAMIERADLSFVSVWSPTFFTALIEAIPGLAKQLAGQLSGNARRRLAQALVNSRIDVERLWPSLAVISCWTDGPSRFFADKLQTLCPSVALDAKGLLATEAAVTVPYGGGEGALPALDSVFIEFIAATGQPLMSHELECGGDYRVVVTTPGGLYRYDLGDRVRCVGFEGSAPRLVFLGRAAEVSDLVGEKLDDAFVAEALRACGAPAALKPCRTPHPHYELWLDKRNLPTADLVVAVDRALRANPQYAYARDLGQLGAIEIVAKADFAANFAAAAIRAGRRLGDVKPVGLLREN